MQDAAAACREILSLEPDDVDALGLLGLVTHQTGHHEAAVELISRAIALRSGEAVLHSNLGEVYRALGKLDEAVRSYREAIRLDPSSVDAHHNLGIALLSLGQLSEAEASSREAIRLHPRFAGAYNNLGLIRQRQGDESGAMALFRQALEIREDFIEARSNLAMALIGQGRIAEAMQTYGEALRLRPDDPEMMRNYGHLLQGEGRLDEALEYFRSATRLNPNFAAAYFDQGIIYQSKEMSDEAIAAYATTLRLQPDHFQACNNLALLYCVRSRPDQSVEYCKQGIAVSPSCGRLHSTMARALTGQGRADEAIAEFRKAAELSPNESCEQSKYLYAMNVHPQFAAAVIFAEHLKWAARHAEPLTAIAVRPINDRTHHRRLRLGYVSPNFRHHAVNYFVEPILAYHNHEEFEIFCYSDVAIPDDTTARLRAAADEWRQTHDRSDEQLAQIVRDDQIDVLVDLTGHIGGNRLLAFARKPAPIQVTYIGYQNTTGMTAMDYRLTDERADPPGLTDRFHTERLVRLPRAFFCYQPSADSPAVTPLPALERGYVTFGSFNDFAKMNPAVVEAWWRILERVSCSRLIVLAYRGGYLEKQLTEQATQRGIDPARIELFDKRPRLDYLRLINQADIALDPFPFNGHTTTCDSIWQGVPVVMLQGHTYCSRFGGSVLANAGLESLIADSVDEYVEIAASLAEDLPRLGELRKSLRSTMAASPLLDFSGFTRNLEQAYRKMWLTWCASHR